jgi:hypothetical protein
VAERMGRDVEEHRLGAFEPLPEHGLHMVRAVEVLASTVT